MGMCSFTNMSLLSAQEAIDILSIFIRWKASRKCSDLMDGYVLALDLDFCDLDRVVMVEAEH